MKTEMELAEILDRCLEKVRAGTPVTDVLRQHPEEAEQLRPLLALAVGLELLPDPSYSLEGAMRTFAGAVEQHQRDTSAKPTASRAGLWPLSWFAQIRHRARAATAPRVGFRPALALYRLAAVALVAVILYWGAGTISANTVPGDFLYPLKLLTERVRFFLTINTEDKTELRIVFSSKRLREAVQQYQRSGTLDPSLLQQMLEEARQAVASSLTLPRASRELLVAQTEHLSRFQRRTLQRFQQQLPAEEQAVVGPYVEMSERRAAWMRQMCDDWRGETSTAQPQNTPRRWMDMCPD